MSAASVKPLFRAVSGGGKKPHPAQMMITGCDRKQRRPDEGRDPLDFDPTPPSATEAVLREELPHVLRHGRVVWETAARDGHGRWLSHSFALGLGYTALLLNADWPAARINGMDRLLTEHPPSVEYLCCWKIDFRGGGSPPQRNSWFIWDVNRPAPEGGGWLRKRLYKEGSDLGQEVLI